MRFTLGIFLLLAFVQPLKAVANTDVKTVTATQFTYEQQQQQAELTYKPWAIHMGFSNIDSTEGSTIKENGKGVTITVQREVLEKLDLGVSFTNYTLNNKLMSSAGETYYQKVRHTSVFDLFSEFKPIQLEFTQGFFFEAGINAGVSFVTASESEPSPFFYGIGASLDFNREIGVRADLKTYVSKASVNTLSLVGYF